MVNVQKRHGCFVHRITLVFHILSTLTVSIHRRENKADLSLAKLIDTDSDTGPSRSKRQ